MTRKSFVFDFSREASTRFELKLLKAMEWPDYWSTKTTQETFETVLSSSENSTDKLDELIPLERAPSKDTSQRVERRKDPSRLLPCRTFLSCGSCSFDEKCQFLHCESLRWRQKCSDLYTEPTMISSVPKRQGREVSDAFFFPTPPRKKGYPARIDSEYKPSPNLFFRAGTPACLSNRLAALSTWSLWNWLIDFLNEDCLDKLDESRGRNAINNFHTGRPRLPIFHLLGRGEPAPPRNHQKNC